MSKAKKTVTAIGERLANIDQLVGAKIAAVAASLAPGAKPKAVDKLGKLFGETVPADVRAWFTWHDGQRPNAFTALIPDTNWSALSSAQVIATHDFLSSTDEIMQPWKDTWIPLFENGGGDHQCFDRESGAIVTWYHDDAMRPKPYKSFAALVEAIEKGYAKMKAVKGIPGPSIKKWTALTRAPTEAQLAKLPVGSAFQYIADLPMGRRHNIHIKLGDDRWLRCSGINLTRAVAQWAELAAKPPAESSGYYHTAWNTWYQLERYKKTLKQGT